MAAKLIANGASLQVLVNGIPVGLATQASYDEDWGITPANVLNYLGPVDYDSQNYSCAINLGTFWPEIPGSGPWPDGGTKTLGDFLPTRSQVQSNNGKPQEFDLLQFLNTATGQIVAQFRKCVLASNGMQISPNSFITVNVRMMSVERVI